MPLPCRQAWLLPILPLLILACGGGNAREERPKPGGPCVYATIPGKARCLEVVEQPSGTEAHCTFTPDDPNAVLRFPLGAGDHFLLTPADPADRNAAWFLAHGVQPGKELVCLCQEIREGSCSPVHYTFPALPGVLSY